MNNQYLLRGLFLLSIALFFGLGSLAYPLGALSRPGAGLFALLISCILGLLGLAMVVRSRFEERIVLDLKYRNLIIVLGSLCGFAVISEYLNMSLAIVFLVFGSGLAATEFSFKRNVKISISLLIVAFLFQKLLGLNLPLY